MGNRLSNPYRNPTGQWIRGSFHGHCSENSGCASVPLAEGVRQYRDIGVGFVALTDHDAITDLAAMRSQYPELVFLEGFEHSEREHMVFVGSQVEPLHELPLEEAMRSAGDLLTIVSHPRPHRDSDEYWTLGKLSDLGTWPDGIEIYNGHYGTPEALARGRYPFGTALWDEVLTIGHRVWGFADDDFHDPGDFGNAFNMVLVDEVTPGAIVNAARHGRCYASSGLLLSEVTEADGLVTVVVDAPCAGTFVGPGGRELARSEGTRFTCRVGDQAYVRFQAEGEAGLLFLQPLFKSN